MSEVSVRPAVPDDGPEIARVHVQSWHEAYTGRVPDSLLTRLDRTSSSRRWAARLRGEVPPGGQPGGQTWVAVRGRSVVGFASAGPCRDPDRSTADEELWALYILQAEYGTGTGKALMDAALDDRPATLWVLADNPRAQAFYAKHGFEPDGATRDDARWGATLHEVRLARG
ncbi:GNAT family N-acetyltransferase [Microbacterium enclense]|uniref:GNAT family N-acetyltransferase n=1 Tax=Microbacterium enclense TaxID=993073 RepID=UPI0036DB5A5A